MDYCSSGERSPRNTGSGRTLHRARGWSEAAIEGIRVTYSDPRIFQRYGVSQTQT